MGDVQIVTPFSSRKGRRFEPHAELSLHPLAEPAAASLPGRKGKVFLFPEVPGPLGVPDFIALTGGGEWLWKRKSAGVLPLLSEADCSVLAVLHRRRALSPATIARRTRWSIEALEPVLYRLEGAGALEMTTGGAYRVNPALVPSGSLFALEAKLKDWRRAVLQGRAYRSWADNYVVLLGSVGSTARRRAVASVTDDGAGLYSWGGWMVRPRGARRSTPAKRLWGFEYLYAATVSLPPTF